MAALFLVCTLAAQTTPAVAQTNQNGSDTANAGSARSEKTAQARPIGSDIVHLDGALSEDFWAGIPAVSDFVQKEPVEGAQPSLATEVKIGFDANALYIGALMEADPDELRAPVGRRDDEGQADYFLVSLDTYRDGRTAYSFGVTAGGTRFDRYHSSDDESNFDNAYDPVWSARTRRTESGWSVEMRIPLSQLRFTPGDQQVWGLNLVRSIPAREEMVFWVPVPRDETGWASRFGALEGLEAASVSRGIELLPYLASGATFVAEPDPANPFADSRRTQTRVGADFKVGLGSNLTLDATVNPDFGQVEADPAEVNLSAFETFFSERRPFFTEGAQLINRSGLFYSRRIGSLPRVPTGGDYADRPDQATILGAAKLTGRLSSGTSIGALGAATDAESAKIWTEDQGFASSPITPRTYTGVGTVVQEFGEDASTVGLQVTGLKRSFDEGGLFAEYLHHSALGARLDWNLRFSQGRYTVFGAAGASHVRGDPTALLRTQLSSVHYFQRPDQDHVQVDSTQTSLSGGSGFLGVAKNSGEHWLWEVFLSAESPGFEINDAGRLGDAGEIGAFTTLTYRENDPGSWYRRYSVSLGQENLWTAARDRQFGAIRSDAQVTLPNFWRVDLTGWFDVRSVSKGLSRGGPLVGQGHAWTVIARLQNSAASDTRWNARIYHGEGEDGNRTQRLTAALFLRPSPRLQLSVEPNYLRVTNPKQYFTTLDGGRPVTFGRRYVFSFIERSTLFAQLRASYALQPDLTLELYAEPFASSGQYHGFGELDAPRSRTRRAYGTDGTSITQTEAGGLMITDGDDTFTLSNRDFNVRSFRSNAVLRWEWRPGSTLFFVWQQDRFSSLREGALVGVSDLWDAVTTPGAHRLILKASYWLPVG